MFFSKKWLSFLFGLVLLFTLGCKASRNGTSSLENAIQSSITEVGTRSYNEDKSYLLVVEKPNQSEFSLFIVLNVNSAEVILKKKFRPGHVRWSDNSTIELLDIPGMIESNKDIEEYKQYISINPPSKE